VNTIEALRSIEALEAAMKAEHDKAWAKLMAYKAEDLAINAEAEEVSAFLADPEPERSIGGWVHRAALGTLPTFATLSTAYANLPVKE